MAGVLLQYEQSATHTWRLIGIARLLEPAACESCERRALFVFSYTFESSSGELLVCEHHLQELLQDDTYLFASLVCKLHEYLEPLGSPLLLT